MPENAHVEEGWGSGVRRSQSDVQSNSSETRRLGIELNSNRTSRRTAFVYSVKMYTETYRLRIFRMS